MLFFDKKYEESLTLIEEALKDNQEDILLNRFAMYNNNALENFEQAAQYGAAYINNDANADLLTAQDYAIYGNALKKIDRPNEYVALLEKAVAKNPEDAKAILENTLLNNPMWTSLTAVKEGKYYVLDSNLYNLKPNARWGEAYEQLADILYPMQ